MAIYKVEGRLLPSQSKPHQLTKALIGWKKDGPLKKPLCFGA